MTRETSLMQQHQRATLEQIGDHLRQVREDHALSLDEMAERTLIQPRILRAIEAGRLNQLPETVYIQGFIKRYADALGLNGTECAETFPADGVMRVPPSVDAWNESPAAQLRPLHLYVAYVALIMASVSLLSYVVNRSTPMASPVQSATTPLIPGQDPAAQMPPNPSLPKLQASLQNRINPPQASSSASTQSTTKSAQPIAIPKPSLNSSVNPGTNSVVRANQNQPLLLASDPSVKVEVKLTDQSWVRVEVDGKTDFEGVLNEGTQRSWIAEKQVTIRAGNAGAVTATYNGGKAKPLGEPGAVEEVTFSANQNAASLPTTIAPIQ